MTDTFETYRTKLAENSIFYVAASSLYMSGYTYSPELRFPLERIYDIPELIAPDSGDNTHLFNAYCRRSLTCVAAQAGSGKTMLARMMTKALAVEETSPELREFIDKTGLQQIMDAGVQYPALLSLRDLKTEDIEAYLTELFGVTKEELWQNRHRILLIFDGLEEISRRMQEKAFEFLRKWFREGEAHAIILMRPDEAQLPDWINEVCDVRWLHIRKMDERHIFGADDRKGMVYRLLCCLQEEDVANAQGELLNQFYDRYEYIRNLCQTPLNVLMVTNLLLSRRALPDKYSLEQYVLINTIENLLQWKLPEDARLNAMTRLRLLAYCALQMESEGVYDVPAEQFIEWFETGIDKLDYYVDADRVLIENEVRIYASSLGLLRERFDQELDGFTLEFAHREFQSVLAAYAVLAVYSRRLDLGDYNNLMDICEAFVFFHSSQRAMLKYLFEAVYEMEDSNCRQFRYALLAFLCWFWSDHEMQQFVGTLEMTDDEKYFLLRKLSPLTPAWCGYLKAEESFLGKREGWVAHLLEDENDPQALDVAGLLYGMNFESRDAIRDEILKSAPGDDRIPLLAAAFSYSHYTTDMDQSAEAAYHAMFECLAADPRIDLLIRMHLDAATREFGSWLPNKTDYQWFTPELVHRAIDKIADADSDVDLCIAVSRLVFPPTPALLKDAVVYAAAQCGAVKERITSLLVDNYDRNIGLLFARRLIGGEGYADAAEGLREDLIDLIDPRRFFWWPYLYHLRRTAVKELPLPRQMSLPTHLSNEALYDSRLFNLLLSFDEAALCQYPIACSLLLEKLERDHDRLSSQDLSLFGPCPEGISTCLCRILNEAQSGPIATMHRLLLHCFYDDVSGNRKLGYSELVGPYRMNWPELAPMVEEKIKGQEKKTLAYLQAETASFTEEDWRLVLEHWAGALDVTKSEAVWVYLAALTCDAGRACFERIDDGRVRFVRSDNEDPLEFALIDIWYRTGGCCPLPALGADTKVAIDSLVNVLPIETAFVIWYGPASKPAEIFLLNYVNGEFEDGESFTPEDYHKLLSVFVELARRGDNIGCVAMTGSLLYNNARALLTTEDRVTWAFRISDDDTFYFRPADWFETITKWVTFNRDGPYSIRERSWFAYLRDGNETRMRYEAKCLAPEPVRRFEGILRSSDDASGELSRFSAEDWWEILYHYAPIGWYADVRDDRFSPAILALGCEAGRTWLQDEETFRLHDRKWRLFAEFISKWEMSSERRYTPVMGHLYWDNEKDRLVILREDG